MMSSTTFTSGPAADLWAFYRSHWNKASARTVAQATPTPSALSQMTVPLDTTRGSALDLRV
jgi:hypothetical protein